MNKLERAAVIYASAAVGAAAVSYIRGKRTFSEIGTDVLVHGLIVGTAVNTVWWLYDEQTDQFVPVPVQVQQQPYGQAPQIAHRNSPDEDPGLPYGKMAAAGIAILSQIDTDKLYKAAKWAGVEVAPSPSDPNVVVLAQD